MSDPICIVVDVGASLVKGVAKGSQGPKILSMSPYCAPSDSESCERLSRLHGDTLGLESSWVADPDGYYLLGRHASSYQGAAIAVGERKNVRALYQVLGVLGAFAQQFGLPKHSSINLCILLPISEYASSEALIKDLKIAMANFRYCGKDYSFKVADIRTKPEGAGVIMRGLPKSIPVSSRIASMMGGFRNFSRIVMDGGKPDINSSKTSDFGFNWLVERVMEATGQTQNDFVLRNLVAGFSGAECDLEILSQGHRLLPLYWKQIDGWLAGLEPVDHAIAVGGTLHLLEDFVRGNKPSWHYPDAVHAEIKKFIPNSSLAFRFIDPYCIYKGLAA